MHIANLLMGDELEQDPIGLTLESTFANGSLDAKVSLQTAARLALDAVGRVSFSVGTEPFSVDVDMAAPVSLKITGAAELEDIWPLTGQYDHILGGNVAVDMALSGSIEQPQLQGTFAIDQANYRNLTTGFRMEAPRLGFSLADGLLKLDPVVATDGGKGTINLSGWVKPFSPDGIEADLKGALAQVKLVRRRATTVTASGDLHYTQAGDAAAVSGNVTIDDAEISLTEQLPSSVVPLEVTELNRPDGLIALPEPPTAQGAAPMITAKVMSANKLFVRGRGLESEWKGNLVLKGDLDAPQLTGTLELIRGDFQFSGKRFDFDKGLITFSGSTDIDPLIDATAIYEVETLRAQINLSGPVSNPVLSLSSSPELPEEEILPRIMFGTESERLSPIQAAQLAAAAASMSGGGGGFDVVGKIRKALSLERLEIGTTTGENGTSPLIRGGKYLTDNIYVEVGTARDDGDGNSASVDVELTKNITVGTEATTQGNQKLRLRWKWDY